MKIQIFCCFQSLRKTESFAFFQVNDFMITHYIFRAFFLVIRLSFIFIRIPDKYIAITIKTPKFNPNPQPAIFSYMLLGVSNPNASIVTNAIIPIKVANAYRRSRRSQGILPTSLGPSLRHLLELAGVEPASKGPFITVSSITVNALTFP